MTTVTGVDLALRAALIGYTLQARGGTLEQANAVVDSTVERLGVPVTSADLLDFMAALQDDSAVALGY